MPSSVDSSDAPLSPCGGCAYSRRDFVTLGAGALAAIALAGCSSDGGGGGVGPITPPPPTAVLPPGVSIAGNTVTVDVTVASDLTQAPGLVFIIGRTNRPVLIVKSEAGTFAAATYRAFNATCPHAQTQNAWADAGADVRCEAHGSQFARNDGSVTAGVASRGLTALPTTRTGNTLTINAG
ncbi:MAG: Rieske (2Fe-2S) protein [Gemmatimonadaceae bacterium]|nr:Rieske (2Fe-2S) protein [Gemmatimonadaceae bacterium]